MSLLNFLRETQAEIRTQINDRISDPEASYPYQESIFTEVVMQHMADNGMTFDPQVCHFSRKIGNAKLSLSGYAISEEADQLDLFVSLYKGNEELEDISDEETKKAATQCIRLLSDSVNGRLAEKIDKSEDVYSLILTIRKSYGNLDQIRIYVLTDMVAKAKRFQPRDVAGKTVKLEVMDIERLYRHWSAGKPRDELMVNFEDLTGMPLNCVYVPGTEYDYALSAIPAETLYFLYEKHGARLLEANVRSFLSATGKVNKGIRDTLLESPDKFLAYNNGIVLVADQGGFREGQNGSVGGILWLQGIQIVNGGQTTASIYFTKRKNPGTDLSKVRVPSKIIILRSKDQGIEEELISDISRFANTQNVVKLSDLSANKPFHVEIEKLSTQVYCPDGVSRWFYERASGSFKTFFLREGTTPAKLRKLKETIPASRKITKTDLAKYLNTWDGHPDLVSFGSQKNFERFMQRLSEREAKGENIIPGVSEFKHMIAKAIIFKRTQSIIRPSFQAFQANIATYVVALIADRMGKRIDLEKIWRNQSISGGFQRLISECAKEVNEILHQSAGGRMISEWAKKPDCWKTVREHHYSTPIENFPELN